MKNYKDYMDKLSVDETLHGRIMYRLTQAHTRQHADTNNLRKYIFTAACVTAILFFVAGVYLRINIWNTTPNRISSNIPNTTAEPELHRDKSDTLQQGSAVYHDVDASELIRQASSGKIPYGFFFNNRLIELVNTNPGTKNNGVRWEERKYTKSDVESALQTSVKNPDLPDGDYTVKQYVLVDNATKNVIAYQTAYYYFNKDTLEFRNRFSVFYFADQYFRTDALEHMKNTSISNDGIFISNFPKPANVHAKVPYVSKLVYAKNDVLVVIEAEADFVQEDGVVDKEKSLERYRQTDKELVEIMKSLI